MEQRPALWPQNAEAMQAFGRLSARRQPGFSSICRISYQEMLNYCLIYGIAQMDELADKVCAMDEAFIVLVNEKEAQKT